MTPEQFFESFVEGNLDDFLDQPGDIRRGFNAAVSISHLADHYYYYAKRHQPELIVRYQSLGSFIEKISKKTGGVFRDVRSVSNVYKHLYSDEGNLSQHSSVNSCGAIEELRVENDEYIQSLEESYVCNDRNVEKSGVIVKRKDGSDFELRDVLESAVEYFRELVYKSK